MTTDSKLLIKLRNTATNKPVWVHICYIDKELYSLFKQKEEEEGISLNERLSVWVNRTFDKEDFSVNTLKDFSKLKQLVKDYYKKEYPEVYRESPTDRQGWMRVWITSMIKEDIDSVE